MTTQLTIGFAGLGNMGWPMAANLHAAGFPLIVRDADASRQAAFTAEHPGAVAARAAGDFAAAGIVVTMLPDGSVVADALLRWGIGAALAPGAVVVEMSSADPADTVATAAELAAGGVHMVDAPVSGGVPRAVSGELALMVGGDDADVVRVQPVLRVLGDPARQFRTGALGTGHAMKALNNVVGAATHCATAEAVVAGARFGLDPKVVVDVLNASTGSSFTSQTVFAGNVLTGAYGTGFALGLMAKDVRIAQSVIAAAGTDAPVLALTDERWARALGELGPAADQSRAHQSWWPDRLADQ
jgi:3-hydroxyisobutyrate dehydrogenase